jgi:hypothetical protein
MGRAKSTPRRKLSCPRTCSRLVKVGWWEAFLVAAHQLQEELTPVLLFFELAFPEGVDEAIADLSHVQQQDAKAQEERERGCRCHHRGSRASQQQHRVVPSSSSSAQQGRAGLRE